MLIIDSNAAMAAALDGPLEPELRRLLTIRRDQLDGYDLDLADMARIVVVAAGDSLTDVEAALQLPIATNLVDGSTIGTSNFTPSWEYAERHPSGWTEIVYILSDDGFGLVLMVPDVDGIDPTLSRVCALAESALDQGQHAPAA